MSKLHLSFSEIDIHSLNKKLERIKLLEGRKCLRGIVTSSAVKLGKVLRRLEPILGKTSNGIQGRVSEKQVAGDTQEGPGKTHSTGLRQGGETWRRRANGKQGLQVRVGVSSFGIG
jgi:hypothetical protein